MMNKVILQIGLLVFFLGVLFFTRMGLPLQDILFRSVILFLALTIIMSVIAIMFLKSLKKISPGMTNEFSENPDRNE
jgi:uncharacterized membrane protein YhhN